MTELFVHVQARDLYPPEGEVRSAVVEAKSRQDDVETTSIAEEFPTSQVVQSLYKKVSDTKSTIAQARNANRDKSLYHFASRTLAQNSDRHTELREMMDRVKAGENLLEGEFASLKHLIKELYRDTLQDFSGVVASTPVGITLLLIRQSFRPDLVIVDEAVTMDEMSLLVPIAHFSPKAWVIVGDIAQKPPHMTMEHDLGPGKTTPTPSTLQKQTSLLHRVVEGGARHSTLSMNMRAHSDVGKPANNLYYNNIMLWRHK
ncbi:Ff.00g090030.m01.CDS01 [Fusarium sp. VM40]|nr:Ff.00g090030.m01.CDS01 [Fusarium sp. VM40]